MENKQPTEAQRKEFWFVLVGAIFTLLLALSILWLIAWWLPLLTILLAVVLVGYLKLVEMVFMGGNTQ